MILSCSENIISEREEKRGDRLRGSAIHWLKKFNFQNECDLSIDTEKLSTNQICDLILSTIKNH